MNNWGDIPLPPFLSDLLCFALFLGDGRVATANNLSTHLTWCACVCLCVFLSRCGHWTGAVVQGKNMHSHATDAFV